MTAQRIILILVAVVLALAILFLSPVAGAAQRGFAEPQAAARALYEAVRAGDPKGIEAILGPGSTDLVDSGDAAEDMAGRARFVAAYEEAARIQPRGAERAQLVLGPQEWRFPFPLVKQGGTWRFDAKAGRDEVIARRIGRNELAAIEAALAYVDAQRDYALARHDGVGPGLYAQRLASTPGRHDGLYWVPTREDPLSPLGVVFTLAAADEAGAEAPRPYHGYFFRVLRAQGPDAPGGARDYVVNGRMIGGFALVAWPARYRLTGVRTFVVSHDAAVYSRDLGPDTAKAARALERFDPDEKWRRETGGAASAGEARERSRRAAGDLGCTVCHREGPAPREAGDAPPLAPSFREIAARYRGQLGAEERLTAIVMEGADPGARHWKDRADFTEMGANVPRISPDEARALVRWILGGEAR